MKKLLLGLGAFLGVAFLLLWSSGSAHAATGPDLQCTNTTQEVTIGSLQDYCYKSDGYQDVVGSSATYWNVTTDDGGGGYYPYADVRDDSGVPASTSWEILPMPGGSYRAEAAYDICQDDCASTGDEEMMIWVDNHDQTPWSGETKVTTIFADNYTWTLYRHSSTQYIWETNGNNQPVTSGSFNLQDMVADTGMTGLNGTEFGWEVPNTGDVPVSFRLESFSG